MTSVTETAGRRQRWLYKEDQARGETPVRRGEREEAGRGRGARLVCVRCGHPITTAGERIEMDGLHEHTQVNPHGYIWRFGCFASAPGCVPTSPPSTEFSWFPGHAWRVESCRGCALHLGWQFVSGEGGFHGLILDRLVERDPHEDPS